MRLPCFEVSNFGHEGAQHLHVRAGNRGTERVVPPAGEDYAFEREVWVRHVEVYVSPAGRSVRVWVDGQEVKP